MIDSTLLQKMVKYDALRREREVAQKNVDEVAERQAALQAVVDDIDAKLLEIEGASQEFLSKGAIVAEVAHAKA